jgi:hypothetical protein
MKLLVAVVVLCSAVPAFAQGGEPRSGALKTKIDPGRAGVFIDGKYVGTAANFKRAHKFNLNAGEHEVVIVDPRYEEFRTKVTIVAGETAVISQDLRKLPTPQGPFGRLRTVKFDKYAAVYLNGKFQGHADELNSRTQGLLIQPGEYALRVESMTGDPVHEETVRIQEGKVTVVRAR